VIVIAMVMREMEMEMEMEMMELLDRFLARLRNLRREIAMLLWCRIKTEGPKDEKWKPTRLTKRSTQLNL
jgi:hypothetical protein